MVKVLKYILLLPIISNLLRRLCSMYAVVRYEKGLDEYLGGTFVRPWIEGSASHVINISVAEQNLLDIKKILDKAGIRFWLMFGTFLGAYRDKGIIPYDQDTDLAMNIESTKRLIECEREFKAHGFYLGLDPFIAVLYRGGEHTDIYLFQAEGDKRFWNTIKYDGLAFSKFNSIEFLGGSWRILNNPERWLKYTYGEDWKTPIKNKGILGYAYGEEFENDR